MVHVAQPGQHPGLALPVGGVAQPGEEPLPHRRVRRERGPQEGEAGEPVRVLDAGRLQGQDLLRSRCPADRQGRAEGGEVPLGEGHPGHRLVLRPDAPQLRHAFRGPDQTVPRAEIGGPAGRLGAVRHPGPQHRFDPRGRGPARLVAHERPGRGREVAEQPLGVLLDGFRPEPAQEQLEPVADGDLPLQHRVPQRAPGDAAGQGIRDVRGRRHQEPDAVRVEPEAAVLDPAPVRQHEARRGPLQVDRRRRVGEQHGGPDLAVVVSQQQLEPLRPPARPVGGVRLLERDPAAGVAAPGPALDGNGRTAGLLHPHRAPRPQVGRGARIEDVDELRPRGVAVRERPQVLAEAVAEPLLPHEPLELPHQDRRLLVDDRPVERPRLLQVLQRLPDGIGPGGAVDAVGGLVVREEEPEVVVHLGERGVHDLGREEVGEHLLRPDVVEPVHGDEVAEPHVGGLVGDEAGPAEGTRPESPTRPA